MTREEHKNIVNQMLALVTAENQATASELLTQLTDDYEQTLTNNETLTTTNATLTANNEKLRSVNAELFLKVGTTKKETNNEKENNDKEKETDLPTIESLFNEKGELI